MEANWLAKILDEIEGYACENGLDTLLAEVRNARRITSLEVGEAGAAVTSPGGSPLASARPDAGLSPPTDG